MKTYVNMPRPHRPGTPLEYVPTGSISMDYVLNGDPERFRHLDKIIEQVANDVQEEMVTTGDGTEIVELRKNEEKRKQLALDVDRKALSTLLKRKTGLHGDDQKFVIASVINEVVGLGPIEPLWQNDEITEVIANGPEDIYVEVGGKLQKASGVRFRSQEHLLHICQRILSPLNRKLDVKTPLADGRLFDGSRVNAVHQTIAPKGPLLTIRRFPKVNLSLVDLVNMGAMDKDMALTLAWLVGNKATSLVVGGTGTGKALAVDTPIPTPNGFVAMGDLQVGDKVFDEWGVPVEVVGAFDVMVDHPCYRVVFSDGSSIVADGEHLWEIHREKKTSENGFTSGESAEGGDSSDNENLTLGGLLGELKDVFPGEHVSRKKHSAGFGNPAGVDNTHVVGSAEVVDTETIRRMVSSGEWTCHVRVAKPVNLPDRKYGTAPRDMGRAIQIRNVEMYEKKNAVKFDTPLVSDGYRHGLDEVAVPDLFIPEEYFVGSERQRWELLFGLFDPPPQDFPQKSSGSVASNGTGENSSGNNDDGFDGYSGGGNRGTLESFGDSPLPQPGNPESFNEFLMSGETSVFWETNGTYEEMLYEKESFEYETGEDEDEEWDYQLNSVFDLTTFDDLVVGGQKFVTASRPLAQQVKSLIDSLGYVGCVKEEVSWKGVSTWLVGFDTKTDHVSGLREPATETTPEEDFPFFVGGEETWREGKPHKTSTFDTVGEDYIANTRMIVAVEPVVSVPVRCIRVDSPTHLFLAGESFIPTHNTTMLNALSATIPKNERVVTIEDSLELRLDPKAHVAAMEGRPPDASGKNDITIRALVKNALRQRPDRIVVGEIRDQAALDMLQACNTGHEGSMSTVHANGPNEALIRMAVMVAQGGEIPADKVDWLVGSALDLIIMIKRYKDGSRRVSGVYEIPEYTIREDGIPVPLRTIPIWEWERTGEDHAGRFTGEYRKVGDFSEYLKEKLSLRFEPMPTWEELQEMCAYQSADETDAGGADSADVLSTVTPRVSGAPATGAVAPSGAPIKKPSLTVPLIPQNEMPSYPPAPQRNS